MMELRRGDIVAINLYPVKGDEVGKIRPCLIISDDESNAMLKTIMVMPLSTHLIENMLPYRMRLKQRGNLKQDSDVLINHMRAISIKRVTSYIDKITENEYQEIIANLCKNF